MASKGVITSIEAIEFKHDTALTEEDPYYNKILACHGRVASILAIVWSIVDIKEDPYE